MYIVRYFISSVLLLSVLYGGQVASQEIKGDTLYTSFGLPVILHFPSPVTECRYSNGETSVGFHTKVINSAVALSAKSDNAGPTVLLVTEGGRNHSFVLIFKKTLIPGELSRNWSSLQDLKEYAALVDAKNSGMNGANSPSKSSTGVVPLTGNDTAQPVGQANIPQPEPEIAGKKETAKAAQLADEKKFRMQVSAANKALAAQNYTEAKRNFLLALEMKAGDVNAQRGLQMSQQKMDSAAEAQRKDSIYESVLSMAHSAIGNLDYMQAKKYFEDAHAMKPAEQLPVSMIAHVESAVQNLAKRQAYKDSVEKVAQTRSEIENANKKVLDKNWVGALASYKKVLKLSPTPEQENFAKKKIEAINLEFERIAQTKGKKEVISQGSGAKETALTYSEVAAMAAPEKPAVVKANSEANATGTLSPEEEKRRDQERITARKIQINEWMDKGQEAILAKDYTNAKIYYKNAIDLFPSMEKEKFARKKIQEIDLEIERRKGTSEAAIDSLKLVKEAEDAQREEHLDSVFTYAQHAIMGKNWLEAKTYYQQALALSPTLSQEEFTKKKIETIDLELAKEGKEVNVAKPLTFKPESKTERITLPQLSNKTEAIHTDTSNKAVLLKSDMSAAAVLKSSDTTVTQTPKKATENIAAAAAKNSPPVVSPTQTSSDTTVTQASKKATENIAAATAKNSPPVVSPTQTSSDTTVTQASKKATENIAAATAKNSPPVVSPTQTSSDTTVTQASKKTIENITAAAPKNSSVVVLPILKNNDTAIVVKQPKANQSTPAAISKNAAGSFADSLLGSPQNKDRNLRPVQRLATPRDTIAAVAASYTAAANQKKLSPGVRSSLKEAEEKRREQEQILLLKVQINDWMQKGQQALGAKNWDSARMFYNNAISLEPSFEQQQTARNKIKEIDLELAKEMSVMGKDTAISTAHAVTNSEAQGLIPVAKPAAEKATSPIAAPSRPDTTKSATIINSDEAARKARILDLLIAAQQAIIVKNFESARAFYKEVLGLQPSAYQQEFAKMEIRTLDIEVAKQKHTVVPKRPVNGKNVTAASVTKTENSSAPSSDTTARKLSVAKTSNQEYVAAAQPAKTNDSARFRNPLEDMQLSNTILQKSPRINIADSDNAVKMVCEDITFNGRDAYIKILIKNKSSFADFTGSDLQLTYIKNYGILIKKQPLGISGNLYVQAGKEAELVFVTDAYPDAEANEIFILEMEDKTKQTKLTIHISGEVYLQLIK